MDKIIKSINELIFEVYSIAVYHAGYGHKKIMVTIYYNGNYKEFSATTNNMPDYDMVNDLEGNERINSLYEIIANGIEDAIIEWLCE